MEQQRRSMRVNSCLFLCKKYVRHWRITWFLHKPLDIKHTRRESQPFTHRRRQAVAVHKSGAEPQVMGALHQSSEGVAHEIFTEPVLVRLESGTESTQEKIQTDSQTKRTSKYPLILYANRLDATCAPLPTIPLASREASSCAELLA